MNAYSYDEKNQQTFSNWFAALSFDVKKDFAARVTADQPAQDLSDVLRAFLVTNGHSAEWLNAFVDNLWEFSNDLPPALPVQEINMTDTKYNGWTNYATWRVNLEMFDCTTFEDFAGEGADPSQACVVHFAETLKQHVEDQIYDTAGEGIAADYALAFVADVNWREIAHHMIENAIRD